VSASEQTPFDSFINNGGMETAEPQIVNMENLNGNVLIELDDGRSGIFPTTLLYEVFFCGRAPENFAVCASPSNLDN